ncbi:MAG: isochorismate synthase [Anaerolineae bacterium]|nr:isochorismate synthase [Anaerolineae bacterium]
MELEVALTSLVTRAQPRVVLSLPCAADVDLLRLLEVGRGRARCFWQTPEGEGFAGIGAAHRARIVRGDRFRAAKRWAAQWLKPLHLLGADDAPEPLMMGGFAFDTRSDERWHVFGSAHFLLPRVMLRWTAEGKWLSVVASDAAEAQRIWHRVHQALRRKKRELAPTSCHDSSPIAQPERAIWLAQAQHAIEAVRRGALRKVVLARAVHYPHYTPDPVNALARLRQRYAGSHCFLFEPQPGYAFFGATPEVLAEVRGRALRTMALAGSAPRGRTPEEDAARAQALLDSAKDRHEHALVVEAIVATLRPLSQAVHAADSPDVLRLPNILHLHTPINAELRPEVNVWDVVAHLHPTPAVGGLPRSAALALMQRLEPFARGWYAAPIGVANAAGEGRFAVAIRSALATPHGVTLFAGAGIVADSDPEREWEETALKLRPLLEAITGT